MTENLSDKAPLTEEDYYKSPQGYIIYTEKYHLKRGFCCKSGCKHCPYGYDANTGLVRKSTPKTT